MALSHTYTEVLLVILLALDAIGADALDTFYWGYFYFRVLNLCFKRERNLSSLDPATIQIRRGQFEFSQIQAA